MLDRPQDVAFGRMAVRLERHVVVDVHEVPRGRMPPRVYAADTIGPDPDRRQSLAVRKLRYPVSRGRAEQGLRDEPRDAMTGRSERVCGRSASDSEQRGASRE